MAARYDNVLIDLAGVLYQGEAALPGAPGALSRLRQAGVGVGFVTNTTRRTGAALVKTLAGLGFDIADSEVLTAARAARDYLQTHDERAHLLIHPDLMPELQDLSGQAPEAVVVGDAGEHFTYASLNHAFRVLMGTEAPRLIALGDNRYFADGASLSLDMGPFVQALAYASGIEPTVVGKPAAPFFEAALHRIGATPETTAMIGDDLTSDVGGAQGAGLAGILVRTGKYRPGDEHDARVHPAHVADDFPAAVDWVLGARE